MRFKATRLTKDNEKTIANAEKYFFINNDSYLTNYLSRIVFSHNPEKTNFILGERLNE